MKDYLITVERKNKFNSNSLQNIRVNNKSESFIKGMMAGLKIAYPKNEVYKQEIKKLKNECNS